MEDVLDRTGIAIGQHHGNACLVGRDVGDEAGHHIRPVKEIRDAAETFRFALGEEAAVGCVKPGQFAVVLWSYNYRMSMTGDVVIIGGGVIGLSVAYQLAKERVPVVLVDKGDLGQESSWAGAGILPPASMEAAHDPLGQLQALSASLFPALSEELRQRTGVDNGYRRCGGLEFVEDDAPADEWRAEGVAYEQLTRVDSVRR